MSSVKNLFVVVMLMGVSYGAYQVISAPEPINYEDQEIEELDIQIGSRLDEPSLNSNITPDDPNPFPEAPKLPTINNEMPAHSASVTPPLSPPELKASELQLPELKIPESSKFKDPVALVPPQASSADSGFAAPPASESQASSFAPPASAPATGQFAPSPMAPSNTNNVANTPQQPIQNSFVPDPPAETIPAQPASSQFAASQNSPAQNLAAQGGGSFSRQPDTSLTPITPRPNVQTPAESMNQFVAGAQDTVSSAIDQNAEQFNSIPEMATNTTQQAAETVRSNVENKVMEPVRNATEMLNETKDGMASKANGLLQGAQATTNNAMDTVSNGVSDALAIPGTTSTASAAAATIDWNGIQQMATNGKVREALQQLSTNYDATLSQDQRMQLLNWLDLLAGNVIYSTEHLLNTSPYVVQADDTLDSIANRWNVPAQLIYNVNQSKIADPSALVPGTELKAIPGPFNAVVNLERQEMTLFLQGMYAGRFPIELGQDGGIEHGSFIVEQKLPGKDYTGTDGQSIAAATPENPYGKYWIGLNGNVAIHESNPLPGQQDTRGSIRLSSRDAADVFGILSSGSQVSIRR